MRSVFVAVVVVFSYVASVMAAEKVATEKVAVEKSQSSGSEWAKVVEIPTPGPNEKIIQTHLHRAGQAVVFATAEIEPSMRTGTGNIPVSRNRCYLYSFKGKNSGQVVRLKVDKDYRNAHEYTRAIQVFFAPRGGIVALGLPTSFWTEEGRFLGSEERGVVNDAATLLTPREGDRVVWWNMGMASIWSSKVQVGTVHHAGGIITSAALSGDGKRLLTVGPLFFTCWDTDGANIASTKRLKVRENLIVKSSQSQAASMSYDGSCAAILYQNGEVYIASPAPKNGARKEAMIVWQAPLAPEGIAGKARSVQFEEREGSSRLVIVCDWEGLSASETRILTLNASVPGSEVVSIGAQPGAIGAHFLDQATIAGYGQGGLVMWDVANFTSEEVEVEGSYEKGELSNDGKTFAALTEGGKALVLFKRGSLRTTAVR